MTGGAGILGGSFDPPHIGHLMMARTAADKLGLDEVYLMPALRPPHKDPEGLSAWEDRLEMTRLAARDLDNVEVSLQEIHTPGASYTVELLRRFRSRYNGYLYFILGADSLRDMPRWREPEAIVDLATIVVFPRSGIAPVLEMGGHVSIVVIEAPVIDVSSSGLREKCRAGGSIEGLVPQPVLDYILDHSLYTR
jgi:nicotinate-nucleotide adenylyltransferase